MKLKSIIISGVEIFVGDTVAYHYTQLTFDTPYSHELDMPDNISCKKIVKIKSINKENDVYDIYFDDNTTKILWEYDRATASIYKINVIKEVEKIIKPTTREELLSTINEHIKKYGYNCDLNNIDVSAITDMSYLFTETSFNGNISKWNVSHVTNMHGMFGYSKFNGDISKWNVDNVTDMSCMFYHSKFNGNISKWNVSNVTNMMGMFYHSKFNGDISNWDVSKVIDMSSMFLISKFNQDISMWNTENVCCHCDFVTNNIFKQKQLPHFIH